MVKSLSDVTMVAWSQSPEQGCVKRLSHRLETTIGVGRNRKGVGENPLNRNGVTVTRKGDG